MGIIGSRSTHVIEASVVGLEFAPGLESDSSPYFWDSDSNFSDSDLDLDLDLAYETKVKAITFLTVGIFLAPEPHKSLNR